MKASRQWIRRAVLWGATGGVTAAMIIAGTSAQAAHTPQHPGASQALAKNGPGYGPPKGIYKPFTDCPLLNPLMQESTPGTPTGCVAGDVISGSIKIGNITTKIKATAKVQYPVAVQFGIWEPPNATPYPWSGGVLPPPVGGLSAQLVSAPQKVPGGLLKALGCPARKNPTVRRLCAEAEHRGGSYLRVYASAQSAGPITGFDLASWYQPVEFHLINPLLGSSCYIGSDDNPVMLNPMLTATGLVPEPDPHPRYHPDTEVLELTGATATDTTFTAPGVTGCGPGGTANIAVDEAIDTTTGLPTASGDSITLNGTFYLAACYAPQNMAKILLSAFRASVRTKGKAVAIPLTPANLQRFGIRVQHIR
jgi:hypothetical protein